MRHLARARALGGPFRARRDEKSPGPSARSRPLPPKITPVAIRSLVKSGEEKIQEIFGAGIRMKLTAPPLPVLNVS